MKEIKTAKGVFLFKELPDGAINFRMPIETSLYCDTPNKKGVKIVDLNGFYFIGTTHLITEEQAKLLCEYIDRVNGGSFTCRVIDNYYHGTAIQALKSLIQANELDLNKNYLILKKV